MNRAIMNKENQIKIKEIAKDIPFLNLEREVFVSADRKEWHSWMLSEEDTTVIAEALCDKGYRKESETAKEIYKELRKQFCGPDGQYRQIIYDCGEGEHLEDIDDLIDWGKYGVEVEEGYHKTVWHKVADGDLPAFYKNVLVAVKRAVKDGDDYIFTTIGKIAPYMIDVVTWDIQGLCFGDEVIAWAELPTYTE